MLERGTDNYKLASHHIRKQIWDSRAVKVRWTNSPTHQSRDDVLQETRFELEADSPARIALANGQLIR
jgi:hypothetical protein